MTDFTAAMQRIRDSLKSECLLYSPSVKQNKPDTDKPESEDIRLQDTKVESGDS